MAKFKPMELIDKMSGKFHSKSKFYAAERYGTQFTGKIGDNDTPPTQAQVAQRERFAQAKANVQALSTEDVAAYKEAFAKQRKYKTLQGYMLAKEMAKIGE
jgi:ABC-type sugar transport system substrate-binding protein